MARFVPTCGGYLTDGVDASKEEPQYLMKREKSGGTAVHEPDPLERA